MEAVYPKPEGEVPLALWEIKSDGAYTQFRQLIWAAGFIQADGAVCTFERSRKTHCEQITDGGVFACQVDREPLDLLIKLFGGTLYLRKERVDRHGTHHNPIYNWKVLRRKALYAAVALVPFLMGRKREKAFEIINGYKKRKQHRSPMRDPKGRFLVQYPHKLRGIPFTDAEDNFILFHALNGAKVKPLADNCLRSRRGIRRRLAKLGVNGYGYRRPGPQ